MHALANTSIKSYVSVFYIANLIYNVHCFKEMIKTLRKSLHQQSDGIPVKFKARKRNLL